MIVNVFCSLPQLLDNKLGEIFYIFIFCQAQSQLQVKLSWKVNFPTFLSECWPSKLIGIGRRPQYFLKTEDESKNVGKMENEIKFFSKMEDNLYFNGNGWRLQFKVNGRQPQFTSPSFSWAWHGSAPACYFLLLFVYNS